MFALFVIAALFFGGAGAYVVEDTVYRAVAQHHQAPTAPAYRRVTFKNGWPDLCFVHDAIIKCPPARVVAKPSGHYPPTPVGVPGSHIGINNEAPGPVVAEALTWHLRVMGCLPPSPTHNVCHGQEHGDFSTKAECLVAKAALIKRLPEIARKSIPETRGTITDIECYSD